MKYHNYDYYRFKLKSDRRIFTLILYVVLLSFILIVGVLPAKAQDIMPLSEVKPGMPCYGLTVFKGTSPEKFEGEVLGIQPPSIKYPCSQVVVQFRGGPITDRGPILEETNIMRGMSGSPVYSDDGRVIGMVSSTYVGTKLPQAVVTPIECLINFKPVALNKRNKWLDHTSHVKSFSDGFGGRIQPTLRSGEYFAFCDVFGDQKSCGGATVIMADPADPSIVYLTGHAVSNIIQNGITAVPLFKAEVIGFSPNILLSHKIGAVVGEEPIGAVIFNGPFGQIGKLGAVAKTFSVSISLSGVLNSKTIKNDYQVAYVPNLFSTLVSIISRKLGLVDSLSDVDITTYVSAKGFAPVVSFGKFDFPSTVPDTVKMFTGRKIDPAITNVDIRLMARISYEVMDLKSVKCEIPDNIDNASDETVKNQEQGDGKIGCVFSVTAEGEAGRIVYSRYYSFDSSYQGKTLYVSNGEELAGIIINSKMPKQELVGLLNKVTDRNALYIYAKNYESQSGSSAPVSITIKLTTTNSQKDNFGDVSNSSGHNYGWKRGGEAKDSITILRKLPKVETERKAPYFFSGSQSFTVPKSEEKQEEKNEQNDPVTEKDAAKKKKRFWLF